MFWHEILLNNQAFECLTHVGNKHCGHRGRVVSVVQVPEADVVGTNEVEVVFEDRRIGHIGAQLLQAHQLQAVLVVAEVVVIM